MNQENIILFKKIFYNTHCIKTLKSIKQNSFRYRENEYTHILQDAGAIVRIATINSPLQFSFEITELGEDILELEKDINKSKEL